MSEPAEKAASEKVTPPRAFISYSHDSHEHAERVLSLAVRLRESGIDATIDQFAPAPPEGWPMWMERQIQKADFVLLVCTETYLKRVEGREEAGKGRGVLWEAVEIYNLINEADTPVQKFIPVVFDDPPFIPLRLRGFTYYRLSMEDGYEDLYRHLTNQPRHEIPALGKLKTLSPIRPQSYPLIEKPVRAGPSNNADQRNRKHILSRVRSDWIDGVLDRSLYKFARIELGLDLKPDAVEHPLNAVVQIWDQPPEPLAAGTRVMDVFAEHGQALLILGAPGSGKTTLMLELLRDLLDQADQDDNCLMPVVFNLSSWAGKRRPLAEWLAEELKQREYAPKSVAQQWIKSEQILPLLDGLDEVAAVHRGACVEAINAFHRDSPSLPIAVCSRIADYEALGTKLRLLSAVLVQLLTPEQVNRYLEHVGEPSKNIRAALTADPGLWELLQTPLMLWVAILAYRDTPPELLSGNTPEQVRSRLFSNFVSAMLKRRAPETKYTPEQIVGWLAWLASALRRNNVTIFYLESLKPAFLPSHKLEWLSKAAIFVVISLAYVVGYGLIGMIGGMTATFRERLSDELSKGLQLGLLVALIMGLAGAIADFPPAERARFGLVGIEDRIRAAVRVSLIIGLIVGVITGLIGGLIGGQDDWLSYGLSFGAIAGLIVGVPAGLIRLLFIETAEIRTHSNQGTRRSVKMALATTLFLGLIVGLIFGLDDGGFRGRLSSSLSAGLNLGLIVGGFAGGLFALRHFAVRLVLWMSRAAPLNYVRFLDFAAERLILRKVGGGYIFIHRMVLEYFTSQAGADEQISTSGAHQTR